MREISPAENLSSEEFFKTLPPEYQEIVTKIRNEKKSGQRPYPPARLIDKSSLLTENM